MKLNPIILATAVVLAGHASGATISGNLVGLTTTALGGPTGAATNGNLDRQYSYDFVGTGPALGATVTFTYTLGTSNGNLSNTFDYDNIFRYAGSTTDPNVGSGQSFTLTIDSIAINSGWTLDSVAKSNIVQVTSEATRTTRFSVNGGASFDFVPTGTTGSNAGRDFTDSRFTAFDAAGDTLSFQNVDQTTGGGQNLRNLAFSFEVTQVPEPAASLLGGLGMLVLLRRRRA